VLGDVLGEERETWSPQRPVFLDIDTVRVPKEEHVSPVASSYLHVAKW